MRYCRKSFSGLDNRRSFLFVNIKNTLIVHGNVFEAEKKLSKDVKYVFKSAFYRFGVIKKKNTKFFSFPKKYENNNNLLKI